MDRITIREVDNTSNVETLSSYDVVYVPGFALNADKSRFRVPTLVTTKYQFLKLYGSQTESQEDNEQVPTFLYDQAYPVATASTKGFPSYAIPNYATLVISDTPVMDVDDNSGAAIFSSMEEVETFFEKVDIVAAQGEDDWVKAEGVNYFLLTSTGEGSSIVYSMTYSDLPKGENETYVEIYGASGSNNVYTSALNPKSENWYELPVGGDYVLTEDEQISTESNVSIKIKNYYREVRNTPPMFYAGQPDPGYRYALYLLSLGIPVYYEQMNGPFEEVDLLNDYTSALMNYGTYDEDTGGYEISPALNGWYSYDGVTYKKCTDTSIVYDKDTEASAIGEWYTGADIEVQSMYDGLEKRFTTDPKAPDYSFDSMGDYSIKYVTSGGYPTFEYGLLTPDEDHEEPWVSSGLAEAMMTLCHARADALALIDHTNNPDRSIYEADPLSVVYKAREDFSSVDGTILSHGAMFTPWYSCTNSIITGPTNNTYLDSFMPASLAYLSALAVQLRNYNPWLAVSGVTRGKVPYLGSLHTNQPLTNNVADSYQSVPYDVIADYALISINPITYIRQYGYCIWGNRTLRNNKTGTKATSFLNIRNLVSDVKKALYEASQRLLFEQNTDILWINFKHLVTPLLDSMVSNYILSDYTMTKYNINPESGEAVPAYMVLANITIRPINSVEVFDLTVTLENNQISVTEVE